MEKIRIISVDATFDDAFDYQSNEELGLCCNTGSCCFGWKPNDD